MNSIEDQWRVVSGRWLVFCIPFTFHVLRNTHYEPLTTDH
jgi:hypothetical protein